MAVVICQFLNGELSTALRSPTLGLGTQYLEHT
jgi:hypothetical protein